MAEGREIPGELDRSAFEELYLALEKPIFNVVYRWLWDREDSRDVVQEAFVRLWRARARIDTSTVEPFLYRIALNLAANRRRRRRLWKWVPWEQGGSRTGDGDDLARAGEPPLEQAADRLVDAERESAAVRRAVDRLPERYRRVVMLCEFSDMSYADVAKTLGIPAGTVASRRHTALRRLKKRLTGLQRGGRE